MVQIIKRIHIPRISHHFWLLVQRNLMFIYFRTVSCGPKKEIRIMWCLNPMVFRKGQTWSNPRFFSWISAKMGFHWETWPCYKISCKWHLGNMREEEHLPSLFGMGATCQFPDGQIFSNSVPTPCASLLSSTSTWFFRGLFGLILLMSQIPYSNCPKNQLNNKYKLPSLKLA